MTHASVAVVTDSTACLPAHLIEKCAGKLTVVPLTVRVDGESFLEGVGDTASRVVNALDEGQTVSTSRPSPGRFRAVYDELRQDGATHIVSVHASSAMSSTVEAARLAAVEAECEIVVIDSATAGMALGFAALVGAATAHRGGSLGEVTNSVREVLDSSSTFIVVDSLEPLRRGGRIGRASALVGSALSLKPLLTINEGQIAPLERIRTRSKARARLREKTLQVCQETGARGQGRTVLVGVHMADAEAAMQFAQELIAADDEARTASAATSSQDREEGVTSAHGQSEGASRGESLNVVPALLTGVVMAHAGSGVVATAVVSAPSDLVEDLGFSPEMSS